MKKMHLLYKDERFPLNLSIIYIRIIFFIAEHQPVKISDLAKHFMISLPAITQHINYLVETKWVWREQNKQDHRIINIVLSKTAKNKISKLKQMRKQRIEWIFNELESQDKTTLLQILSKLDQSLNKKLKE